jgi:hypothetical protein
VGSSSAEPLRESEPPGSPRYKGWIGNWHRAV